MKIATYNVNGVNGRLGVLLRWLEEASPDVVCLQELKAPDPKFPVKAIEAAGYGAIWHGQKSWNGVAILARDRELDRTVGWTCGGRSMTMNDWRAELRLELEKLVDAAVVAGARQRDVYAAILDEIGQLRLAYERDPDPADDISEQVIEEPSNNWPAAD